MTPTVENPKLDNEVNYSKVLQPHEVADYIWVHEIE